MINVTICAETDEVLVVAFAVRRAYSLEVNDLRAAPWITLSDIALTNEGEKLGNAMFSASFTLVCDDGLTFVGCRATGLSMTKFLAEDILDANGDSLFEE